MHPIIIEIGSFKIHAYGAMLALAFIQGILWTVWQGRKEGIKSDDILDLSIYIIVVTIIACRIGYVITNMEQYSAHFFWDAFKIWDGGLSFHGGVVGGALAVIIYCRIKKIPVFKIGDVIMPCLAFGLALGRIGCFLNGCCFGCAAPAGLPWSVTFPLANSPVRDFHNNPLPEPPFDGQLRHPAQLYDSIMNVAIALLLVFVLKRFKRKDGDIFAFWLILSGISRYIMEMFRYGVSSKPFMAGLTLAQWVCVLMILAGMVMYMMKWGEAKKAGSEG